MDRALDSIGRLLRGAEGEDRPFPPTLLFEEGWMLRLVLQWFSESDTTGHDLSFAPGARWFSEARLASAFLPRYRGDKLAEGYTHADGVIGHFQIGENTQAELTLKSDAQQFIVVEAKMFSRHPPDDIQIRGNRITVPPPRERHPIPSHPMA